MRSSVSAVVLAAILTTTGCLPRTDTTTTPTGPTAVPPVTPPPATAHTDARHALAGLLVRPEDTGAHYRRANWGDWATHAGQCSTRAIVLRRQATSVTTGKACRITGGRWISPYDNTTITDPKSLDIDHRVPVAEAVRSGARHWDRAQRERFYNDLDNLVAVSARANRSKGDNDPGRWRPSNRDEWCGYAAAYIATKTRYQLTIDPREHDGLIALLNTCPQPELFT